MSEATKVRIVASGSVLCCRDLKKIIPAGRRRGAVC